MGSPLALGVSPGTKFRDDQQPGEGLRTKWSPMWLDPGAAPTTTTQLATGGLYLRKCGAYGGVHSRGSARPSGWHKTTGTRADGNEPGAGQQLSGSTSAIGVCTQPVWHHDLSPSQAWFGL